MLDCHAHVFRPAVATKLSAAIGREFGHAPAGTGTPEDLLAQLAQAGLDSAICLNAALRPDQMIPANKWALELKRTYPGLIPFGTVHPEHPDWLAELDRLWRQGIRGLKIHPDLSVQPLDSPMWDPIWEEVSGKFTILTHMGPTKPGHPTASPPHALAHVLDRHHRLTVIAAHLGGLHQWEETLATLAGRPLFLDTSCAVSAIAPATLRALLDRHDHDMILFGSDYPLYSPASALMALERALDATELSVDTVLTNGVRLLHSLTTV